MGRFLSVLFFLLVLVSGASAQTHVRFQNQPQRLNFLITYHTAAPGVTDDKNDGYMVGSIWIDTTADVIYQATDVTAGAANWVKLQPYIGTSIVEDSDSVNIAKSLEIGTITNSVQLIRGAGITGTKGYTFARNVNADFAMTTGVFSAGNCLTTNSDSVIIDASAPCASAATARVYNSTNISISDSVSTILTFDSERWDANSLHSTSSATSRITMDAARSCLVSVSVKWSATGGTLRDTWITLNGGAIIAALDAPINSSSFTTLSTVYKFAQGDYVEAVVFQDSGGPINIVAAPNYSPEMSVICF